MKFTATILAFLSATAHAAMPRMGAADREMLMKHAVKVDSSSSSKATTPRKLFELSGDYSIQFKTCSTITTEPYRNDLFYSEYNLQAAQSGAIKSQNSYVVFNACQTGKCSYNGNDNLFMVDLKTYVQTTMPYYPTKKTRYCTVCQMSEEYCQEMYQKQQEYDEYQQQQQQEYYNYQQQQQYQNNNYQGQQQNYQGQNYQGQQQQQQQQNYGNRKLQNGNYYGQYGGQQQNYGGQYGGQQQNYGGQYGGQQQNYGGQNQQQAAEENYSNNYGGQDQYANQNNGNDDEDSSTVEAVTCKECAAKQCFEDDWYTEDEDNGQQYQNYQGQQQGQNGYQYNNNDEDIDYDELIEYVSDLSSCVETDYQYNGQKLYAGFICNGDGSGVEIGMFLDQYCSIYTSQTSYLTAVASGGDSDSMMYAYAAQEIVTYPFVNDIDCADTLAYATPWGSYNQGNYYYQDPPSQYCSGLFQGTAVSLKDCDSDGQNDSQQANYAYNGYGGQQNNDYYSNYNFYKYQLSQQDLSNSAKVCQTVKSVRGEYNPVYDSSGGSMFDYSAGKKSQRINNRNAPVFEGERRGLKVFGLLMGFIIALVAVIFFMKDFCGLGSSFDSKREQLVIEGDKAYAREM